MKALDAFFTPTVRKAIYGLVAAILKVLLATNIISPGQINTAVTAVAQAVAALTAILALAHVS